MNKFLPVLVQLLIVFSLATGTEVFAAQCAVDVSSETWAFKLHANKQQQAEYLAALKPCISNDVKAQAAVDTLAITSLSDLDELPTDQQSKVADFVIQTLEINARAGYASSQHNYAMLFNERPGSLLTKLIKQDQMTFGLWTKMAAAQGEPRALFNLAMRMAVGLKEAGIAKDLETAYTLLILLEQLSTDPNLEIGAKNVLQGIEPFITQTKAAISSTLGKKRTKQISATAAYFNYSTLAPRQELLNADWDHKNNIQNAVENFLRKQNATGTEDLMKYIKQCYTAASGEKGLTIQLEYCVAFDSVNIEYTSSVYQQLATKQKTKKAQKPQPEETTKSVGIYRIVKEMTNAKVDNSSAVTVDIYKQAVETLIKVVIPESA